jgi:succinylarginine dihydrolase
MPTREFNFDGIVGPTHNYSGLSYGNVASSTHQRQVSSPRAAALQGLRKMKFLADLGIGQCVLPPQLRPRLDFLRQLGFSGSDSQMMDCAHAADPVLLAVCYSASNMWTANAATVSAAADCEDQRLHMTPANLASTMHRALEPRTTTRVLRSIFADESHFAVHDPLPASMALTDEGAANHTRLAARHGDPGIELFVFGHAPLNRQIAGPKRFPARQTLESCQAIARRHGLDPAMTMFIQQAPQAIDAGVFHNDVIAVGNQNVLMCHQEAFVNQPENLTQIRKQYQRSCDSRIHIVEFTSREISLEQAVSSYLFNSQLITRPDGPMVLVCPLECKENPSAFHCIERLISEDNPVDRVEFFDLRQSMNNGGGPACLRLRVVLTEAQQSRIHPGVILTATLHERLVTWIEKHYREELAPDDLRDPDLLDETRSAISELAAILNLPADVLMDC